MLTLPIKKKWFDMIKDGIKKEEYREIKPYYDSRFSRLVPRINEDYPEYRKLKNIFSVRFRNGYSKTSPTIQCRVELKVDYGKEKWGAEPNKQYYVLKILSVEVVQEWKSGKVGI